MYKGCKNWWLFSIDLYRGTNFAPYTFYCRSKQRVRNCFPGPKGPPIYGRPFAKKESILILEKYYDISACVL